ncbi:MAG: (Fe-S)-binding protein [Terriglobia bacterium]
MKTLTHSPEEMTSANQPGAGSAFDAHHPPSAEIVDKCVHCGFCLQACPTYLLWGEEMDSPRGRIHLVRTALEGLTPVSPGWVEHFDSCLGCMACMTACPSGVDYGSLIEATRAQIERLHRRSFFEKLHRRFLFGVFTRPSRLRLLRWPLLAYQRSGIQALLRRTGVLKLLPRQVQAMENLMPALKRREAVAGVTAAHGTARLRVGLLLGCVQQVFLSPVNAATARVLAAEGFEVVAPEEQSCCGALLLHAGEEEKAAAFARRTIDVFERARVDAIVINAAGCGSNMKEYGRLLRDDPEYAERARRFSAKCKDVSEILAEWEPQAVRHSLPVCVGYQDACHLQHAQGVRIQPRLLLGQIPGLQLVELPEAQICCGSAGIYNLIQPDAARALGDRKAQLIAPLGVDVIATGNPGCLLQLTSALARNGKRTPVLHTIQLLDASIRCTKPGVPNVKLPQSLQPPRLS